MTMKQISAEYRRSAQLLKQRIGELTPLMSEEGLSGKKKP